MFFIYKYIGGDLGLWYNGICFMSTITLVSWLSPKYSQKCISWLTEQLNPLIIVISWT